jgi:hypothetical protein
VLLGGVHLLFLVCVHPLYDGVRKRPVGPDRIGDLRAPVSSRFDGRVVKFHFESGLIIAPSRDLAVFFRDLKL